MKVKALALILFALVFQAAPAALAADPEIKVQPLPLDRGAAGRVSVKGLAPGEAPQGRFDGRPIFFFPVQEGFIGLFGADVMLSPGRYPLEVGWPGGRTSVEVQVRDRSYGTRSIKVPQSQTGLSPENQRRAERERQEVIAALAVKSPEKLWRGPWVEPAGGSVSSSFGRLTRINGVLNPRPHLGTDFNVPMGTEVKAPADGLVVLTGDHFFAGRSIYLDHGHGVISMYFHLSQIDVAAGDKIKRGQRLGLSGASGRVDGAHLHYGIYICQARVDPIAFHRLTSLLPQN